MNDINLERTEPIPDNWLEIGQEQKAAYEKQATPQPTPIEEPEELTEEEKIAELKNAKKYEIKRLTQEKEANSISIQLSDNLDSLTTLTEVNEFNVLDEITTIIDTLDYKKEKKIEELKSKTSTEIYAVYPDYKQRNMALGIYTEEEKQIMVNFINTKRTENDTTETAINNATTPAELEAITI
ncbi:MAG: hypothetical protein GY817_01185 [bacterium]|nr:hypothetical protein [bacterium]